MDYQGDIPSWGLLLPSLFIVFGLLQMPLRQNSNETLQFEREKISPGASRL